MISALRRIIRRGYAPDGTSPDPVRYIDGQGHGIELDALLTKLAPDYDGGIALVLPTYIGRTSGDDTRETLARLYAQLRDVQRAMPDLPCLLVVGLQWEGDQEPEAERRLKAFAHDTAPTGTGFVGISMRRAGKATTLNTVFAWARRIGLRAVAWVDDDVRLGDRCLEVLYRRFLEKGRGALGARKVPQARRQSASRVLRWAKENMKTPVRSYPHGCCMIVESGVAARGIPSRYVCDDDYFCFALLAPSAANPMQDLEVVQGALCHHTVGGPAREIYFRIRRSLFTSQVMQADYDGPVASFYFRRMQFFGLWPLAPFDGSRGFLRGVQKALLKWIYFAWFCEVGAELLVRGLIGKPLRRIHWHAYSEHEFPSLAAPLRGIPGGGS